MGWVIGERGRGSWGCWIEAGKKEKKRESSDFKNEKVKGERLREREREIERKGSP